jgi:hypothetical protein
MQGNKEIWLTEDWVLNYKHKSEKLYFNIVSAYFQSSHVSVGFPICKPIYIDMFLLGKDNSEKATELARD